MQRRRSPSSSRKTPHIGGVISSNNRTNSNAEKRPEAAVFEDTAANDHFLAEFSADIFQAPPSFLQRLFMSYGSIFRRLIFISVMAAVLSYFYPGGLATLISGAKKISSLIENSGGIFSANNNGDGTTDELANIPALREHSLKKSDEVSSVEAKNILSQIASEMTNADTKQQRKNQRQSGLNNELNKAMREKFEHRPLGRVSVRISPKKAVTPPPRVPLQTKQRTRLRTTQAIASKIPEHELNQIIRRYSKNYILGDITAIGELFVESEDAQQQQAVKNLLKGYATLFDNSSQRWVEIQNLRWVHATNRATGTGSIRVESTSEKGRRTIEANVLVELRRVGGVINIARLDFSNEKTSLALSKSRRGVSPSASTLLPSQVELQAMVAQFVTAYERADIDGLVAMFSKDIISNSSSKAEVRQDYEDLFSSSRERKMTISDLGWKFSKKHAKGVGEMKVVVLSRDKKTRIVKGKIQFVVKKIANTVLITHLYHIEYSR